MPEARTCPVCGVKIGKGVLLCKPHWYAVPRLLRARVNSTWHRYRQVARRRDLPLKQRLAAVENYRGASEAAIAAAKRSLP